MASEIVIPVSDLAKRATGRARGKEAFETLKVRLAHCAAEEVQVTVDLSSAEMVTGSFLDELVLRIAELPAGTKIVFRLASESESDVHKLEKVCAIRQAACYYQLGESGPVMPARKRRTSDVKTEAYPAAFFTT